MEGSYAVNNQHRPIGEVRIHARGLYFDVDCQCRLEREGVYRLYMDGLCLGTLLPRQGAWMLSTSKSQRSLQKFKPVFYIVHSQEGGENVRFVPLQNGKTICCLHSLMQARYAIEEGIPGLWVPSEK